MIHHDSQQDNLFSEYPDILTARQVQSALGIGRAGTYKLLESGQLPSFKVGNAYKVPKRLLQQYVIQSCERSGIL